MPLAHGFIAYLVIAMLGVANALLIVRPFTRTLLADYSFSMNAITNIILGIILAVIEFYTLFAVIGLFHRKDKS